MRVRTSLISTQRSLHRGASPLTTNSGIDVLPGTYEIVIKFSTADGLQTQRQTATL